MKKLLLPLANVILLAVLVLSIQGCQPKITLTGRVLDATGSGIADAEVSIKDIKVHSDKEGRFSIEVSEKEPSIYWLTIRKPEYGLYSKKFYAPIKDEKCHLTKGTMLTFDPTKDAVLTDGAISKNFFMPPLLKDTAKLFNMVPRVYDNNGKLVNFGYPAGTENILSYLKNAVTPPKGISVFIPANSLVDTTSGKAPSGMLTAYLNTVDYFNPDGMPGNNTVRSREGDSYMISVGAGSIVITDGEKTYNLKKGLKAKIKVPVYPVQLQSKQDLPKEVDLLYYNEKDGLWDKEQGHMGVYNAAEGVYEAELPHFSYVNMDIIKTGASACLKFRQIVENAGTHLDDYHVQVIVPATTFNPYRESPTVSVTETGVVSPGTAATTGCLDYAGASGHTRLHPVVRLPSAAWVFFIFSDNSASPVPIDIAAVQTDPVKTIPDPLTMLHANCTLDAGGAANVTDDCNICGTSMTGPCPAPDDPTLGLASPLNTTCWLGNCTFVPFENKPTGLEVIAYKSSATEVTVKWICTSCTGVTKIKADLCSGANCLANCDTDNCINGTACNPTFVDGQLATWTTTATTATKVIVEAFDMSNAKLLRVCADIH